MADVRVRAAGQDRGAEAPAPGDALMADGVRAAEDDVQPAGSDLVLDPLVRKAKREDLIVAGNPVLLGRQTRHSANWSRFGSTIAPNLDQFGVCAVFGVWAVSVRLHASLRARAQ